MQSYVENVQDKNEVHRRDNLSHGKSAGDYSKGNSVQLKARMDRDAELSLADMRIHYSASQRENVRSNEVVNRQPVIQRYVLKCKRLIKKDQSPSSSDLPTSSSLSSEAEQQKIVDLGFNQRVFWPLGQKSYFPEEFSPAFANALYKKTGKLPVFVKEKREEGEEGEEVYYASQSVSASVDGVVSEQGYKLMFEFELEKNDIDKLNGLNRQIWVMLPNYATGDQFTLAALVHRDPAVNVLIMQYGNKGKDAEMWSLFKKALNDTSDNDSNDITDQDGKIRVAFQPTGSRRDGVVYSQVPSYATDRVGADYNREEWTSDLRQNWKLPDTPAMWRESREWEQTASKIQEWAKGVVSAAKISDMNSFLEIFSQPHTKHIVILWFRHSGVAGGAHLELDTSMSAMTILIDELLKKENTIIILAGDRRKADANSSGTGQQERESQFTSLLRSKQSRVYDFREFWKTPDALRSWDGTSRIGQIRFYDYLKAYAASLRHIGSRSGNLELLALIGHDVDYFEEINSYGGKRMEPFYNADTMDRGLHYQRISVIRPLTFKGNLVRIANYLLKTGKIEPDITSILPRDQVPNIMAIGKKMWETEPKDWSSMSGKIYEFYLSLYKGIFEHLNGICAQIKSDPSAGSKDISKIDPAFAGSDLEIFGAELKYLNLINPMIARISEAYKTTKGWKILEEYYRNYERVGLDRIVKADYDSQKS